MIALSQLIMYKRMLTVPMDIVLIGVLVINNECIEFIRAIPMHCILAQYHRNNKNIRYDPHNALFLEVVSYLMILAPCIIVIGLIMFFAYGHVQELYLS